MELRDKETKRNLFVVELHDGLLKVAHAAVDQLGAAAAGA